MSDVLMGKAAALLDLVTVVENGADIFAIDGMMRTEVASPELLNKQASEVSTEFAAGYQSMLFNGIGKIAEACGEYDIQDPVAAANEIVDLLCKEAEEAGFFQQMGDKLKDWKNRAMANAEAGRSLTYAGEGPGSIQGKLNSARETLKNLAGSAGANAIQIGTRVVRGGPNAGFVRRNAIPAAALAGAVGLGARAYMNRDQGKKGKDARAEFAAPGSSEVDHALAVLAAHGYNVG